MRYSILAATAAAVIGMSSANAATVSWTEGTRPLEPGSTAIPSTDVPAAPPGFDITQSLPDGDLDVGDMVNLYGRIVSSTDSYQIVANAAFDLNLVGIFHESGGLPNTLSFTLTRVGGGFSQTVTASTDSVAQTLISTVLGGTYDLIIDMDPDNGAATYDLQITADAGNVAGEVPIPGALPLFAAGLGALGAARRKGRKKA